MEEGKSSAKGKAKIGLSLLPDGEEYAVDLSLLPHVLIGPDENGFKKLIQYHYDNDGNKVKVTTTTRVRKLAGAAVERRKWGKFGDAATDDDRSSSFTLVSNKDVYLPARAFAAGLSTGSARVYVPPKRFATLDTPVHGGNAAAILVTNLPEEADERDVKLLFVCFGRLRRVSVPVHPKTGRGKGWAIVNFIWKADAEKAIARVDGHPYGNLILRVGWAN